MTNKITFSVTSFTHERFRIQKPFHANMTRGIEFLLMKVLGRPYFETLRSAQYDRVIPRHDNDPFGDWLCIKTDDGTVIDLRVDTTESIKSLFGRYYGYKSCCIAVVSTSSFINNDGSYEPIPHTGFFPCNACKQLPIKTVVADIESRRYSAKPFPKSLYAVDTVDLLHKIHNGTFPLLETTEASL